MSLSVVDTSVGNGYGFKSEMAIQAWFPVLVFLFGDGTKESPNKICYTAYRLLTRLRAYRSSACGTTYISYGDRLQIELPLYDRSILILCTEEYLQVY